VDAQACRRVGHRRRAYRCRWRQRRDDLSGLAPAWIGVGDLDIFFAEDVAYAQRLDACSVPCELVTVPGMYHAADGYAAKALAAEKFTGSLVEHLRMYL
jgi:acetyl esterase/lipase